MKTLLKECRSFANFINWHKDVYDNRNDYFDVLDEVNALSKFIQLSKAKNKKEIEERITAIRNKIYSNKAEESPTIYGMG